MEEVGETSTVTTEVTTASTTPPIEVEPERQTKESEVSEEPDVVKVSSVSEEPVIAEVSEELKVAKVSQVSKEPDVAKASIASEEPVVAKVSEVSEEPKVAKVSQISEEPDVSKASSEVSEEQEGKPPSIQETVNLDSSHTETTIQTEENVLNLETDHEAILSLADDDTEVQAPHKDFDDEEEIKLREPDQDEYLLQGMGGEDDLLQLLEGEGEEGEIRPQIPQKRQEAEGTVGKRGEKQEKTSLDFIEGIRPSQYSGTDVNVEEIRRSIAEGGPLGVENIFGQIRKALGPAVPMTPDSSIYEEEEEEGGAEQSEEFSILAELGLQLIEKEPIDRDAYEDEYRLLKETERNLRRKNGLLNKKLTEYYLRRKITRVFTDIGIEMFEELLEKYEERMEDLFEVRLRTAREKEAVDNELIDMVHLRDEQMDEIKRNFRDMQDREFEIGHGLIYTKTGKIMPDKVIHHLLQRQQHKTEAIAKIRLAYIKRRDTIREIDQKIKSLETIGGTLHLMDFEQLKMENQNFTDKIEERDEELMKLRDRYSQAMTALAHIREKVNIIEVEIEDMGEKKDIETLNIAKIREELNSLKMRRDYNRAERERLRIQTGILTYPDLLNDMEIRVKTKEILTGVLHDLKETNADNRIKLINIRKNVIFAEQERIKQMNALRKLPSEVRDTFKYSVCK